MGNLLLIIGVSVPIWILFAVTLEIGFKPGKINFGFLLICSFAIVCLLMIAFLLVGDTSWKLIQSKDGSTGWRIVSNDK